MFGVKERLHISSERKLADRADQPTQLYLNCHIVTFDLIFILRPFVQTQRTGVKHSVLTYLFNFCGQVLPHSVQSLLNYLFQTPGDFSQ